MGDRIDYAYNARERVALAIQAPRVECEVPALVLAQIATAEATLALVEQRRIANILELGLVRIENVYSDHPSPAAIVVREGLGL